jgi:asparagine synthase (glutamine-hydrolysing)
VYSKLAAQKMHHRGPDDDGYWNNNHFALSFKRLSILDLSPLGNQPMISQCENYVLVYNGELYNHIDIRKTLKNKGYQFRSTSDSEVVLYALIEWGTNVLSRFNGMFALGFINIREESLLIARDHVGMKPLYYCNLNGNFVFGSQLDHIMHYFHPKYLNINIDALYMYMAIGYYFAPNSVFNEIKQLEPGKWLKIDIKGKEKTGVHFDLTEFYLENQNNRYNQLEFEARLEEAVSSHLMSDVPIGTFLSGGLDSSVITGIVDQKRCKPFDVYTVGDFDKNFDE